MQYIKRIDRLYWRKIGEILDKERRKRGYSMQYLAELTGVKKQTIDHYILGQRRIDDASWKKLCEALQMPEQIHIKIALGMRDYE